MTFVMANASGISMMAVADKANGAAVMSFLNMGVATIGVLSLSLFTIKPLLLPLVYLFLSIVLMVILKAHWFSLKNPAQF